MIVERRAEGEQPRKPEFVWTVVTDPEEIARSQALAAAFRRNMDWLQDHWSDVLPQARGKFLVVAGQEPFIADTADEASAMAQAAHPDDPGHYSQYVFAQPGLRVYAVSR